MTSKSRGYLAEQDAEQRAEHSSFIPAGYDAEEQSDAHALDYRDSLHRRDR